MNPFSRSCGRRWREAPDEGCIRDAAASRKEPSPQPLSRKSGRGASALPFITLALFPTSAPADPVFSRGWTFEEQGGAALYENVCAACHQPDAKGATGAAAYPALAADENLASSAYVLSAVLEGLNAMPPFGGMMSDAQVADVTNYVRSHFGNSYLDTISDSDVAAARQAARPPPK